MTRSRLAPALAATLVAGPGPCRAEIDNGALRDAVKASFDQNYPTIEAPYEDIHRVGFGSSIKTRRSHFGESLYEGVMTPLN